MIDRIVDLLLRSELIPQKDLISAVAGKMGTRTHKADQPSDGRATLCTNQ